jgi:16S rRNA A1518/A1519 N6-dimethyltransferase RsmA/KsgA/DIM1 with predicted DNA glycosylase/AP lyase activity
MAQLDPLLDALFQHRRQALGGLLTKVLGARSKAEALLGAHDVEPGRRPETLSAAAFLALSRDPGWRSRPAGPRKKA